MTIRKVSGATTGIVTKAELVVGTPGIIKAAVTRRQLLATVQSEVDIIKSALISPRTIQHLLYDDEGSSRFLRDFLFIGSKDKIGLGLTKGLADVTAILDVMDMSRLTLGAHSYDTVDTSEHTFFAVDKSLIDNFNPIEAISKGIQNAFIDALLPQTDNTTVLAGKGINDSIDLLDRNLVFNLDVVYRDTFTPVELKSLEPNKALFDVYDVADARVNVLAGKYFYDAFGTFDLAGIFDGITYNAVMRRDDTAALYDVIVKAANLYRSYVDDVLITSPISLEMQPSRAETLLTTDYSNKQIVLNRPEILNPIDVPKLDISTRYFDTAPASDLSVFTFALSMAGRDPLQVFALDTKAIQLDKNLSEDLPIDEARSFAVLKNQFENQDIIEQKYLELDLNRRETQDVFDVGTSLYAFKDIFNSADIAEKTEFIVLKPLAENIDAIEYFAQAFDAVRGEKDGFVETLLTNSFSSLEAGKFTYEELVYVDLFSRVLIGNRSETENTVAEDRIYKLEQRLPAHAIAAADLGYIFNIVKGINDPVNMLDLMGTYDGSKYSLSMDKTENQPVYEYYRPQWRIRRRGRDGFLEEVTVRDLFSIDRKQDIDPLANYVYTFGDTGFRFTPSGGSHYYTGINGELFLKLYAPEWTTFFIGLNRYESVPTPDVFKRVVNFVRNPWHNDLIGGGSDGFANYQPMTDVSANSPYPAKVFTTFIPSPTKGDQYFTNVTSTEAIAKTTFLDAKAGTPYTVINKTVDFVLGTGKKIINPSLQNSSVTVSRTARDRDFVGVFDNSMNYYYAAARPTNDFIIPGGDRSLRYFASENSSETIKFTITKDKFDKDVAGTTGAIVTMGRGTSSVAYPERRSGDALDNPAFTVALRAKPSVLVSLSSETVQAMSSSEGVFVGQRSWQGNTGGFRNAGDRQERIIFDWSKNYSNRDTVGTVGDTGFRYQPSQSSLENTKFTIIKAPGLQGAYDTSVVTFGNWQTLGDRTISSSELVSFVITKDKFDKDVPGTTGAVVTAGRNSSIASVAYPERRSGDKLDNAAFDFYKTAFAGSSVTWTVQLNTIDPSPDVEYQASSVTITYGPKDVDRVGMLDRFFLTYGMNRYILDSVLIGTDTGFRYQPSESSLEWTKFTVTKLIGDIVPMLDLTGIFDGLNSVITLTKAEAVTPGRGTTSVAFPERRSGDKLDNAAFLVTKPIGIGNHNGTPDIFYIGVSSTTTGIRYQPTENTLEYTTFYYVKNANNGTTSYVTVGLSSTASSLRTQPTESNQEYTFFNITKDKFDKDVPGTTGAVVTAGRNSSIASVAYPERRSGDKLDNAAFDFFKTAFAGSSVTWSIQVNTIDPNPDVEYQQSSVTLTYGPKDFDAIGTLDRFFLTYAVRRTFDLDFITIGTDNGFRNQPTQSSLENTYFTITKSRFDFDVPGTTGAIVTMGRGGVASVAYPERRSGDSLDNPAFIFSLDAKVNSSSTFSYSVSGVTVLGRDRDRLFVGQQSWQGNTLGKRNSGDGQERLFYTLFKTADQDGLGSSTAFVVVGSDNGFRYTPSMSNTSETVKFTFVKAPGQNGVADTSVATVGNWQIPGDRTISSSELVTFTFTQLAKQGVNNTWSGYINNSSFTTTAADRGERVYVGDPFQGVYPIRRSGAQAENASFFVALTAKRSVAGTLLLNTIDPSPDIEYQASSVAVAVNAWDLDAVGTLDRFNLFYQITRTFDQDFVTVGLSSTLTGIRYQPTESSIENTWFRITKLIGDSTTMLDLTEIGDGLNSVITIQKQERAIIGFGSSTGVKVSGSLLERIPFDFFKTTGLGGAGSANTIVTIGGDTGFRFQPTQSSLENTKFTFTKAPGLQGAYDTSVVTFGNWQTLGDRTISSSELVTFTITQLAKQGVANTWSGYINNSSFATTAGDRGERVYVGDPLQGVYPLRRSGAQAENIGFNFSKTAFAGSSVTWSIKVNTIDASPDFEWTDSSTTLTYGPKDLDAIGIWDRWWMAFGASRSPIDTITIGTDTGFRYQQYENSSETVKFTFTKSRFDFDIPGTTGALVTIGDVINFVGGRGFNDLLTISDNSGNSPYPAKFLIKTTGLGGAGSANTVAIIGSGVDSRLGYDAEKAAFTITKGRVDFDVPGTSGGVVTIGWGGAAERPRTGITYGGFLGDTISGEATTFNITKLAEQGVNNTWSGFINSSSFSTTAADNGERVYVGDPFRGVYPLRRSGAQAENVSVQYSKTAKIGRVQNATLQFIDGNNGYVSGLATTFNTSDTDIVGVFSGIIDVRTFIRNPWIADYDGIPGALDAYITPDERDYKLLTKRMYLDDGSMGTDNAVIGTALRGRNSSNLLTYSEQITTSNGSWIITNGGINITTDDTTYVNPLGGATGVTRLSPTLANSYIGQEVTSNVVAGMPHSFSIWAKTSGPTSGVGLYADTNGGVVSWDAGSAFNFNGGWVRYTISFVPTTTVGVRVFIGNASVWDQNEPIWVWGAQLSQTTTSIAYVATTDTPVLDIAPDHYAGDTLENVNLLLNLRAKRSVAGTLLLNTIDPSPDVEYQQSSVAVAVNAWDLDAVGTLDYFSIYYMLYRQFDEYLTIGSGVDSRLGYAAEKASFVFTKLLGQFGDNETPILDLAGVYDGNIFTAILSKADVQIVGSGQTSQTFPARMKSGANEIVGFDFYKTTGIGGAGSSNTVVTLGRATDGRLGSAVEKAYFTISTTLGNARNTSVQTVAIAGSGVDDRLGYANEKTYFTVSKTRFDFDVPGTTGAVVVMGRGISSVAYPERRSGDQLDTATFLYGMTANRGTSGTVTLKLIDPTDGNGFNSSAAVSYQPYDYDVVGSIDFMSATVSTGRSVFDSILIGTDTGFRYQSSQNTSETVKFTISKRANEYDGSTSYVVIGYGDLVERPRTGPTIFGQVVSGEGITFNITKSRVDSSAGTTGSVIVVGRGTSSVAYPERRSGDNIDSPDFFISLDAKLNGFNTSVTYTLSGTTIRARDRDAVFVGQQSWQGNTGGFRNAGDSQERILFTVGKKADQDGLGSSLAYVVAGAGDNYGFRYQSSENTSETVKFTIGKFAKEYDGTTSYAMVGRGVTSAAFPERQQPSQTSLENAYFNITMTAKRSVSGSTLLNTIDSAPDIEYRVSSVAVSRGSWELDDVGTLDAFNLFYQITRTFDQEQVTIGTDTGFRYQSSENTSETVKFLIGKNFGRFGGHPFDATVTGEGSTMLDLTNVFDGLLYNYTMLKQEQITIGRGTTSVVYPERRSGSSLEKAAFDLFIDAKVNSSSVFSYTVSGVTVTGRDRDRVFVGQQPWQGNVSTRTAGDGQERIFYTVSKRADADGLGSSTSFIVAGAGDNYGFRYQSSENTSETVKFTVTKPRTESLLIGVGTTSVAYPERRSGTSLENVAFTYGLLANRSVAGSVTFKLIDPVNGNSFNSSNVVNYQDYDYDFVGSVDYMEILASVSRVPFDSITIGSDTGFRYQPSQNSSETVKFTITKFSKLYDGTTSYAQIGWGDLTERPRIGTLSVDVNNNLFGETTKFNILKTYVDKAAGTSGAVVTIGRGTSSVAYPERRSGDNLDTAKFIFSLDAKVNSSSVFSYSVSGVTVLGRDRERVFVGQQSWQGNTGGFKNAGDVQERIPFTIGKKADQDGLGSSVAFVVMGAGNNYGFRYQSSENTSETTYFSIGKFAKDYDGTTSRVVMGRGTTSVAFPERRAGDDIDNVAFDFFKTAKRATTGTLILNTIDPSPDVEYQQSSVSISSNTWDTDAVGTLDRFNLFYVINRFTSDTVTIGTDTGFRYQQFENSSETVKFLVGKNFGRFGGDPFDASITGEGSTMLDLTGVFDGLIYTSALTKQDPITIGRGTTSGVYPERRSGDSLDGVVFDYFKNALYLGNAVGVEYDSPFEASTGIAIRAIRNDQLFTPVFVGSQGYYPAADILANSSTTSVWVQQVRNNGGFTQGATYNFSVYMRRPGNDYVTSSVAVDIGQTGLTIITTTTSFTVTNDWARYNFNFSAPRTSLAIRIRTSSTTTRDALEIYGAQITAGTTPQTYVKTTTTTSASNLLLWSDDFNNATWVKSSNTIVYGNVTKVDILGAGDDWARPGDSQEKLVYDVTKLVDSNGFGSSTAFVTIGAGDNYGFRYQSSENSSETVKFLLSKTNIDTDIPNTTSALVTIDSFYSPLFNLDARVDRIDTTYTVSGTTIRARDRDRLFVGQQSWMGNTGGKRNAGDPLESIVFDLYRPLVEPLIIPDRPYLYNQKGTIYETLTILGEKPGFVNMLFTPGTKVETVSIDEDITISVVFPLNINELYGDLDLNGNINNVASYGNLRMTDYADIDYFDDDYVGEKRSFT